MSKKIIYLDHAAATPLDSGVLKAMTPYFSRQFYNPSSIYQPAREVQRALQTARRDTAKAIGAKPAEIIFTAGATESINLAFHGVLSSGGHCVVSPIEHAAVIQSAKNYEHDFAPVDKTGQLDLSQIESLIGDNTKLISIGLVNNEIGTIQPLKGAALIIKKVLAKRRAEGNSQPLLLHTDASQAAGCMNLDINRLGADMLSFGGAKIYGPKQVGLLWARSSIKLKPLIYGGGQEKGLRSGTENVAGIVGLARAFELAQSQALAESKRLGGLRQSFLDRVTKNLPETMVLSPLKRSASHILSLAWPGLDAERILFRLEAEGVLAASGAACAASKNTRSHALKALGLNDKIVDGSLRFSFGHGNNQRQVLRAAKIVVESVKKEQAGL